MGNSTQNKTHFVCKSITAKNYSAYLDHLKKYHAPLYNWLKKNFKNQDECEHKWVVSMYKFEITTTITTDTCYPYAIELLCTECFKTKEI